MRAASAGPCTRFPCDAAVARRTLRTTRCTAPSRSDRSRDVEKAIEKAAIERVLAAVARNAPDSEIVAACQGCKSAERLAEVLEDRIAEAKKHRENERALPSRSVGPDRPAAASAAPCCEPRPRQCACGRDCRACALVVHRALEDVKVRTERARLDLLWLAQREHVPLRASALSETIDELATALKVRASYALARVLPSGATADVPFRSGSPVPDRKSAHARAMPLQWPTAAAKSPEPWPLDAPSHPIPSRAAVPMRWYRRS